MQYQDGIYFLLMGTVGNTNKVKLAYCKDGEFYEALWKPGKSTRKQRIPMPDVYRWVPDTQALITGQFFVLDPNRNDKGYPQIQIIPERTSSILKLGWKGETVTEAERAEILRKYSMLR